MNVYLDITSKANHSEQVDFEFLCKKLNCFYCLANALSITGSQLQRNIQTKCKEFEKIIAHEIARLATSIWHQIQTFGKLIIWYSKNS